MGYEEPYPDDDRVCNYQMKDGLYCGRHSLNVYFPELDCSLCSHHIYTDDEGLKQYIKLSK